MAIFTNEVIGPLTDAELRATPVPISGTVTANLGIVDGLALDATLTNGTQHTIVDNFPVDADALAQGSTTAGQLGALVMGAVTTSAPTYVTATTRPLSLDEAGNLRTSFVATAALTSTVTQVTSTGANQTLLSANASRKKAILFFETGIWSVKFGATASTTSRTYLVSSSNVTIEVPVWAGRIDAICTTAGKIVNVTDLV